MNTWPEYLCIIALIVLMVITTAALWYDIWKAWKERKAMTPAPDGYNSLACRSANSAVKEEEE